MSLRAGPARASVLVASNTLVVQVEEDSMRCRRPSTRCILLLLGAVLLSGCAGSADPMGEPLHTARLEPEAVLSSVPPSSTRDIDGDGFINPREAAGYFARRFGELDQDGDARLSREEIALEIDQLENPETHFSSLDLDANLMISQAEYFKANSEQFHQRINPTSGMMSSSDFDTMIRFKDPLVTDQMGTDVGR